MLTKMNAESLLKNFKIVGGDRDDRPEGWTKTFKRGPEAVEELRNGEQ